MMPPTKMRSPLMPVAVSGMHNSRAASLQEVLNGFVAVFCNGRCEHLPPPVVQSALQNMVMMYARAQQHHQQKRSLKLSRFSLPHRSFSASELPKMVVFYVAACQRPPLSKHTVQILKQLIDFIRTSTKIVLNLGQRRALQAAWNALREQDQREPRSPQPSNSTELFQMTVQAPSGDSAVDQRKIVEQLAILKKGDYWKHLPSEEAENDGSSIAMSPSLEEEDDENEDDDENDDDVFVDKENIPHLENRMQSVEEEEYVYTYHHRVDPERNISMNRSPANSTQASEYGETMLPSSENRSSEFFVKKITEDGWVCADNLDYDDSACCLLRLPSKVAKLGCDGMKIKGVVLMRRRGNGVLEPCNRRRGL